MKGNQLGWVAFESSPEVGDAAKRWLGLDGSCDWKTACKKQCKELGINFKTVRHHLARTTEIAQSIGDGGTAFCYGAVHRFQEHDIKHALLLLRPVKLTAANKEKFNDIDEGRSVLTSLADLNMDSVLSVCSPAPYGDLLTESTKLDPTIPREETFPQPVFEHQLLQAVKKHLVHGQAVRLVPYKLNIYGEGDFFKPHKDTPVNPQHFIGTVVVCLPSKFSGGELLVSHGSTCQTFDFAEHSGKPGVYQFAAFYGDCLHEIKPVTEGRRVTLTYHILRTETISEPDANDQKIYWPLDLGQMRAFPLARLPKGGPVPQHLQKALKAQLSALSGIGYPYVGFILQHEYTRSGLVPEGLKGGDKVFFDLLREIGWSLRLLPVLVVEEQRQSEGYQSHTQDVFSFTKQDFEFLNGKEDAEFDHGYKDEIPFIWYGEEGKVLEQDSTLGCYEGNYYEPTREALSTYSLASSLI
ncbi:hypothetical protein KFL_002970100 [Klebsormidium nitens]|uniref:Fe2OG dioxygenase domain-containing protein n=1 Tax=Klebsormidium nitens TaxID=105231 RepID=A0A1Y1I9D5_KLENI|nr:hypothetical protein KFL_002970100 [Klebsormidium nitens]|eukprot:GAQ86572.1 hypothetical protein KFL_002970100 [Klebsormidium nitens]